MKKQKIDEKFQELSHVSAKLHHVIESLGAQQTFVTCELFVNMALRDVVIQRGYSDSYELCIDDLIDATELSIALIESADDMTKH
jgi:hypothetical protein